jgi:hypothetical protein
VGGLVAAGLSNKEIAERLVNAWPSILAAPPAQVRRRFDLEPGGLAGAAACRPFVSPAGHRCGVPGWQVFQGVLEP